MASRHLLNMENKRYSGALGTFLMGGNSNFTGYLDASNSVAVDREQLTLLMHFPVIGECLGWRTTDFEELYGDLGQWTMTKELAREVVFIYRVTEWFDE